ncbi:MAG TPA: hypothetical protein VL133_10595 [Devosia sp.]|nr:hypothetical protein [Devosia sp.]
MALLEGHLRAYNTVSLLTMMSLGLGIALLPAMAASIEQSEKNPPHQGVRFALNQAFVSYRT